MSAMYLFLFYRAKLPCIGIMLFCFIFDRMVFSLKAVYIVRGKDKP